MWAIFLAQGMGHQGRGHTSGTPHEFWSDSSRVCARRQDELGWNGFKASSSPWHQRKACFYCSYLHCKWWNRPAHASNIYWQNFPLSTSCNITTLCWLDCGRIPTSGVGTTTYWSNLEMMKTFVNKILSMLMSLPNCSPCIFANSMSDT